MKLFKLDQQLSRLGIYKMDFGGIDYLTYWYIVISNSISSSLLIKMDLDSEIEVLKNKITELENRKRTKWKK